MSRIYMYQSRRDEPVQLDPKKLENSKMPSLQEEERNGHAAWPKPTYGLWASPFTDPDAYVWEYYFHYIFKDPPMPETEKLDQMKEDALNQYLVERGLNRNELWDMDLEQRKMVLEEWEKMPPVYTKEEYAAALKTDEVSYIQSCATKRNEQSFYFAVEQSKTLHVNSLDDIVPFVKEEHVKDVLNGKDGTILFDKINDAGYHGVELHSALNLHDTVFYSWDVDSIVIWNPDCIKPVDRGIAYIARCATGIYNEIDEQDPMMSVNGLIEWIDKNQDIVQQAIDDQIITTEDVTSVLSLKYDISNILQVENQEQKEMAGVDEINLHNR